MRKCHSDSYSNFDCVMPENAEEILRNGDVYIEHTAWGHFGKMYFEDGVFKEEVMRYGSVVGIVEDETLKGLFKKVNEEYGDA